MLTYYWLLLMLLSPNVYSKRDPFNLSEQCWQACNMHNVSMLDLGFLGSIIEEQKKYCFVEDSLGNICQIKLGETIAFEKNKVVDILPDRVVFWDGQQYVVLK